MKRKAYIGIILVGLSSLCAFSLPDWGFFGHRLINRLAVFTLPQDMLSSFKGQIEYISAHAVDPDKRRYAFNGEAVRHYIDADHWGADALQELPRELFKAQLLYSRLYIVCGSDTTEVIVELIPEENRALYVSTDQDRILLEDDACFALKNSLSKSWSLKENNWIDLPESVAVMQTCTDARWYAEESFSSYGILPYFMVEEYDRLVRTFASGDIKRVIRKCTDFGHYIGDAHVPLHTTENYNGQLTDQIGIHAFWESRLPELFALDQYDFFTGQAEYIGDPQEYFWEIIEDSHALVDSVLQIEKRVRAEMAEDQILCYEDRLQRNILTQCAAFSEAYHKAMGSMVEDRMRASVLSIGSVWYSAWVDAGRPYLDTKDIPLTADQKELEEIEKAFRAGEAKGRAHGN